MQEQQHLGDQDIHQDAQYHQDDGGMEGSPGDGREMDGMGGMEDEGMDGMEGMDEDASPSPQRMEEEEPAEN